MKTILHFVNGKSFSGESKRTGKIFNPAIGEQSTEVKLATTKDMNEAVINAKKAFDAWGNTSRIQRGILMIKYKEFYLKN
jgi:malonate-semialdehyde dehydrogenase (acetylating)/methylmalonate-semialdehyde dehydrogenase